MLGGGVMGSGIVHLLMAGGFEAVLWDINYEALDMAEAAIRKSFSYKLKTKKIKPDQLEALLSEKVVKTTSLKDMADVDLVIEAVLENMEVKQGIWKKLQAVCQPDAVFGTNTSALPITDMATVLDDPGRMIGLHFFNPAERMPLLEIICAAKTSDQTLATSVAFARAIKKVPVVVGDGPGFYVSRQLGGLMGGSVFLMADGVDPMAIEAAMKEFGMPMGPATLADLTGIDINYHVGQTFALRLGPRYQPHPLNQAIFALGDYGRKTGRGYFDYSGPQTGPQPTHEPSNRRLPERAQRDPARSRTAGDHRPDAGLGHQRGRPDDGRRHLRPPPGHGPGHDHRHRLPALPGWHPALRRQVGPARSAGQAGGTDRQVRPAFRAGRPGSDHGGRERDLLSQAMSRA